LCYRALPQRCFSVVGVCRGSSRARNCPRYSFKCSVLWIRWVLPRVRVDQLMSVCWRFFMPLALATLVLTVLWVSGLQSPVVRSLQETLSLIMFALSVFAVGYFLRRVLVNLRSTSAQVNVNPWL
jgi:NADH-quinone oxidoreductase subunit H